MKKRFGILFAVVVLLLVMSVAVACDPKEDASKVQISFVTDGGSEVQSIVAEAGSDISELLPAEEPTKDGYYFGGWSLENNGFASEVAALPTTMPEESVTYYARWTWHVTVVPKLQPLDENDEPVEDTAQYTASTDDKDKLVVEVDPQAPSIDLYKDRPVVRGYFDVSTAEEHEAQVTANDMTFYLNYKRSGYNISYNLNNQAVSGRLTGVRKYFGQTLELPDLPIASVEVPTYLRFAGWTTDYEGELNFEPVGKKIIVGEEGSIIDGSTSSVTLYAYYDEGYFDLSMGDDYVFVPKHDEGKAIVSRLGLFEFEGEYVENPNRGEGTPFIGEFSVQTDAGTMLNGRIYEDGHFSYDQRVDSSLWGYGFKAYDYMHRDPIEENVLQFLDSYGCASFTVGKEFAVRTIDEEGVVDMMLEEGTYVGGCWYDDSVGDWCFTYVDNENGGLLIDVHFQFVRLRNDDGTYYDDDEYIAICGTEMGLFCDGISSSGTILGDIVIFDGYGTAVALVGNTQYQGEYSLVLDSDDEYYVSMVSTSGEYLNMYIRIDLATVYGTNSSGLFVMPYEKGDPNLLIWACKNSNGEILSMDGFGNAYYTKADGTVISGEAGLVGEMFETTTPPVAYTITEANGKVHYFILDQGSARQPEEGEESDEYFYIGEFVHTEKEVTLNYLYDSSVAAGEYVGAIASTTDGVAYFLTAYTQSDGSVIFWDLDEGTVTSDGKGGYVYASKDGGYIISYEEDERLTNRYEVPTITTSQMKLSEMSFEVNGDKGTKIGTLTISADGATYALDAAGEGGFENREYEYAYGCAIIRNGENSMTMFVLDSFGEHPKAFATTERTLYAGGTDEPQGMLYTLMYPYTNSDGTQELVETAMLWLYMYGELHFFAVAEIVEIDDSLADDYAVPMSGAQVYIINSVLGDYYAIKQGEDYLAPNTALASGKYNFSNGKEPVAGTTMQLDGYGVAKYTQDGKTFEGSYGVKDGVYMATFEGEGGPGTFKFMLSSTDFVMVNYGEYYVVNPATLAVISMLQIEDGEGDDIIGSSANLYRASEDSDGYVSRNTTPMATGKIEAGDKEGIYKFVGTSNDNFKTPVEFTFRYDENIFTQRVFVRNNVTLPTGTFTEEGVNSATSKKITLDEWGGATYFNGDETIEGFYYIDGSMYRFIDPKDEDLDMRFSLNKTKQRLIIYGAPEKPFEGGEYELTFNRENYTLQMEATEKTVKGTLTKDGQPVAIDEDLEPDEDKIYTFSAQDASDRDYTFKFIVSEGKIVLYDSTLDYEIDILTGNAYLLEEGQPTIADNYIFDVVGVLTVKGFNEVAEVYNYAEYIKGSITHVDNSVVFTDEYGNEQTFDTIAFGNNDALFVEGSEKGLAVEYYYTMGAIGDVLAYFDGKGMAYKVDETGEPTKEQLGYYFYGTNPFAKTQQDLTTCIIVGNFAQEESQTVFNIVASYEPFALRVTNDDGSSRNIMGVVEYKAKYDGVAVADDGSVFIFNGYDGAYYYDSLGMLHEGYFNNYGEMVSEDGTPDNRYLITDEYDNATLYYVNFPETSDSEEGEETASGYIRARRASYTLNTPYTNLYAEVQFTYADDYKPADGSKLPEGKDGVAIVVMLIDGVQGVYQGYFTLEDNIMRIEVIDYETGELTNEFIELTLYVDGTADWENCSYWMETEVEE